MQFVWSDLIHRARVYKDDDHQDEDAWLTPADWLALFNVEYALLYPRWIRAGMIVPTPTDTSFTGSTVSITDVCAVLGVAEDLGDGRYRPLEPAAGMYGRGAFWDTSSDGKSCLWEATGAADNLALTLHPADPTGNYVVRYITRPAYATDVAATVDLPYGGDERLVLGVADRAGIKDATASRKVSELKYDADVALNFLALSRGDGPRVRRRMRVPVTDRFASPFPTHPAYWKFI